MPAYAPSREQELFCRCVELTPSDRAAWLASACAGDAQLKRRLERLLAAHEVAERSCVDEPSFVDRIDAYRIIRIVGEGGMGVVYEAVQEEPIRRRVALKAIRPGLDTLQVLERFRMERQALAAMEHPHIAKVFDAGNTASGRPYFVMEFVDGSPLLQYCAARSLPLRQRLALFVLICQAVQHAHQKGVIHRDLKPGNILVTGDEEAPTPRIIDFGIARATGGDGERGLTRTGLGAGPGTPAYMSPEQAGYNGLDVDTRSDVYSLGVILYELVTGCLPVASEAMASGELLRLLAEGRLEIPAPSVRVAQSKVFTPFPARDLSGDLDAIILKALEPDRDRRYDSALAFAGDVQRFMEGRPVSARPPTLAYRARKYWQRHRVQVTAASIAAAALTVGVAAGAYGLIEARRAEAVAREEAANAKYISAFLTRLFTLSDPNRAPGSPMTVRQVLEEGTRRVQSEMASMPQAQSALLGTLAHVHESIGSYRTAQALAERSLVVRGSTEDAAVGEALITLGRTSHRLGDFEKARQALARAIAIRSRLYGENSIEVAEALNLLGGVEGQLEKFKEAEAAHRSALTIQERVKGPGHIATYNSWRGLGLVFDRQGNYRKALECFRRILPIARQRYGAEHPVVADALHNIAIELDELGELAEAESMYAEALAMQRKLLGREHPSVAFTASGLAHVYRKQGLFHKAEPLYRDALRIREAALGSDNIKTAESRKSLGLVRMAVGTVDEGYAMLAQAIARMEAVYGSKHSDVLAAHRDAGIALVKAGRHKAAVPHLMRVAGPDTPAKVRIDWNDPVFARLKQSGATPQFFAAK